MEDPLSALDHIGLLIFLVISAVALALLVWATVTRQRKEEHREEILFRLGYTLASPPPPQLIAQVTRLHSRTEHQVLELQNVYRRPISGGETYVFDLAHAGGSEATVRAANAIAVVSPALDLPRFALIPRPSILKESTHAGGMLARLTDMALDAAAAQTGLAEVAYPDDPEFAENYIVLAEDQAAVGAFLSDHLRTQLLQWERRYVMEGVENTFTLTRPFVEQPESAPEGVLQTEREDAERILSWFRSSGISYT